MTDYTISCKLSNRRFMPVTAAGSGAGTAVILERKPHHDA